MRIGFSGNLVARGGQEKIIEISPPTPMEDDGS